MTALHEDRRWRLIADDSNHGGLVLFPLDVPVDERDALGAALSTEERTRAGRFLSPTHGQRFTVAHGRLRQMLAGLLGLAPGAIEFAQGPHGKPRLHGTAAGSGLRFNLSHSGTLGLVGWAWHREIGVDVEVWHPLRDQAALVHRYFAPGEIAAWRRLPANQQHEAFFNLWTRKEAYIKGLGRGLSLPLASFEVTHEAGAGACLLLPSPEAADAAPWAVASPDTGPDISVAVALEAGEFHIVAGT